MLIIDYLENREKGKKTCIGYPIIQTKPRSTFLYIAFQSLFYESIHGYVCVRDTCIKKIWNDTIYKVLDHDFYNIKNIS